MKYRERNLRHEMKYIINSGVYEILRLRFFAAMKPDVNAVNGEYRITSLYFDDVYRTSYNDKLMGLESRKKYRIRAYNLSPEKITLEAKYKDNEYISKVNADLTLDEYYRLLNCDFQMGYEEKFTETSMEDMAVSNTVTKLTPMVLVDYFREAYTNEAGNVRFTFDKKLSTSYNTLDMFDKNVSFSPVFEERGGNIILELKYDEYLPSYIGDLLSGFPLTQTSASKFMLCTDKLMEVKKQCAF